MLGMEWISGLVQGLGCWDGVMSLDFFVDGRSRYMYIVLGG